MKTGKIWDELSNVKKNELQKTYDFYKRNMSSLESGSTTAMINYGYMLALEETFGKEALTSEKFVLTWEDFETITGCTLREEYVENDCYVQGIIMDNFDFSLDGSDKSFKDNKFVRHAMAAFKIQKLIEVGYGGIITEDEWADQEIDKYNIGCNATLKEYYIQQIGCNVKEIIAFRTRELAEEFLFYNKQLLDDYFFH